jgi:hypothetical protein
VLSAESALHAADRTAPRARKSVRAIIRPNTVSGRNEVDILPMQLKTEKFDTMTDCTPYLTCKIHKTNR